MRFNIPINANNVVERHKTPFLSSGFRFPTTKEIEESVYAVAGDLFNQPNALVDRYFPTSTTYASEIEMYVLRTQMGESPGMTLVHQLGSNALPVDVRASKIDLSRASWSPIVFKESKTWEEKEMLLLGRLTEEVQSSEIDGQVANFIAWMLQRMKNRRDWMVWQIMRTGKIVIDDSDTYNPSGMHYEIDYQVSDMQIAITNKFDEKDGTSGKSLTDPIEFFLQLKEAAKWKPETMPVKLIVNSYFVDILADNTFMQYRVDYQRGWTAVDMRPPRSVYRAAVLEIFRSETGLEVELYDGTYEDSDGNIQFWIPNGEMVVICQNDRPLGEFVYTGHVAGISQDGKVQIGTGPYVHVDDRSREDPPRYSIIGGFHGMPKVTGYSPKDFTYNRIKWLAYATTATVDGYHTAFPTEGERRPLGSQSSPTGR